MKKKIILASNSPRRRELLSSLGIEFEVVTDNSLEVVGENLLPEEIVCELAEFKWTNVTQKLPSGTDAVVISADTVVSVDGKVLGKPTDEDDAEKMLTMLSGRSHFVYTGVCVRDTFSKKKKKFYVKTEVFFKNLDIIEIKDYINTGEPMDKAGAYGIQDFGALFVEKIHGDYFNVVGLPICKLSEVLKKDFGIKII